MENSSEESSWTFYFEEFLREKDQEPTSIPSVYESQQSSSLVSDAASSTAAMKKVISNGNNEQGVGFCLGASSRNLRFKKKRTKGMVLIDGDLQDTATSPANSPKVNSYFSQLEMKEKDKDIININSKGKIHEKWGLKDEEEMRRDHSDHYSQLKKRGLCLVPLSSLANYLSQNFD